MTLRHHQIEGSIINESSFLDIQEVFGVGWELLKFLNDIYCFVVAERTVLDLKGVGAFDIQRRALPTGMVPLKDAVFNASRSVVRPECNAPVIESNPSLSFLIVHTVVDRPRRRFQKVSLHLIRLCGAYYAKSATIRHLETKVVAIGISL